MGRRTGDLAAAEIARAPSSITVYDSSQRGPRALEELRAAWAYRDLIVELVARDVKTRYKRSVLGIAWTMLHPLLMMAVLTFVFSNVFRFDVEHYPLYMLSAQIIWTFFIQTTTAAANQLAWGGPLITKIYVPKSVFPLSALGTGLVNLLLAMVPLALVVIVTGVPITPAILWLPIPILFAAFLALGVGMLLSTISVWFHDIIDMWQVVLTALYFFTPIMYPKSILPEEYAEMLNLNPVYHIVEAFRLPIYSGWPAGPYTMLAAAIGSISALVLGWLIFTSCADRMAQRV